MLRLAVIALVAGCFPPRFPTADKQMPERAWASGDRATWAYLDNGTLTIVRKDGKLVLKPGHGCYARPARVELTDDGREVYVIAPTGAVCRIDTTTGASFVVPAQQVGDLAPTTRWVIGGLTGWIYRLQTTTQDTVVDRIGQRAAPLPVRVDGSACDVIETPSRAQVACLQGPAVEISELDTSAFPPALLRTRKIDVTEPSAMRFSRDGHLIAIWSQPVLNHAAQARVIELDSLFEVARLRSRFPIVAIDLHDADAALVEEPAYGYGALVVTTFKGMERLHASFKAAVSDVFWLADGRILATGFDGSGLFLP